VRVMLIKVRNTIFLPLYICGFFADKTELGAIPITFSSFYLEKRHKPAKFIIVQIQNKFIQIASATLTIKTHVGFVCRFISNFPISSYFLLLAVSFAVYLSIFALHWTYKGIHFFCASSNACSTCVVGEYQSSACTATSNTVCSACCPVGQYSVGGCSGTTDSVCSACSACPIYQYRSSGCSRTTNSVCSVASCPPHSSGAPNCVCDPGSGGILTWDVVNGSWAGTCYGTAELTWQSWSSTYSVQDGVTAGQLIGELKPPSSLYCSRSLDNTGTIGNQFVCAGTNSQIGEMITIAWIQGCDQYGEFRIGFDWGLGGGVVVDGELVHVVVVNPAGNWWAGEWTSNEVNGVYNLPERLYAAGRHTIQFVGFEDSCDGNGAIQQQVRGGDWAPVDKFFTFKCA